jgi:hypothetical protein
VELVFVPIPIQNDDEGKGMKGVPPLHCIIKISIVSVVKRKEKNYGYSS